MSRDLKLLPAYSTRMLGSESFAKDLLSCDRDEELFSFIEHSSKLHDLDIGDDFYFYFSPTNSQKQTAELHVRVELDDYDNQIKRIQAVHLLRIFDAYIKEQGTNNVGWRNKAIYAYLQRVPSQLFVYLYWC